MPPDLVAVDPIVRPILGGRGYLACLERWNDRVFVQYTLLDEALTQGDTGHELEISDDVGTDYVRYYLSGGGGRGFFECRVGYRTPIPPTASTITLRFLAKDGGPELDRCSVPVEPLA